MDDKQAKEFAASKEYDSILGALRRVSHKAQRRNLTKSLRALKAELQPAARRIVGASVTRTPVGVMAKSEAGAGLMSRGELLAKSIEAAKAGRITARELATIETALNMGRVPDQEGMDRILGTTLAKSAPVNDAPSIKRLLAALPKALEDGRIDFTEAARAETLLNMGERLDDDLAWRITGGAR
ncbi:hypothetical protein DF107_09100 [Burkholderia stagnalis]|uniref:hypothetical protein n=1 Tax=Burkholderia stagnalis TaxID=1503054 RepID=UPI000F5AEB33|nr:hypothetical protein [Burkholderia stagnalis]RQQ13292.1 hypothetical protein DF161_20510 [Burkholderia stagnalis]RQR03967.1 hypothetical protein DF031_04485 [Burkholderia stagnalis]RQX93773.1 hypothetical protein DF120_10235 [Burkholderia stagnalis]RQY83009.1 hypothetical protein DF107_09100 [Burkholderia stagnalis]